MIFANVGHPRLVPEVIAEIRRKPDITFNTYLDRLLSKAIVVERRSFVPFHLARFYDLIDQLTQFLHPFLSQRISCVERSDLPNDEKLKRQLEIVQEVSRSGSIWKSTSEMLPREPGRTDSIRMEELYRHVLRWIPKVHKSWYKYHRERFTALSRGDYSWADERLVCAAVTEALTEPLVACIVTDDWDTDTVFFQFINNAVYHACEHRLRSSSQEVNPGMFQSLFYRVSQQVNAHQKRIIEERGLKKNEWRRRADQHGIAKANLDAVLALARPGDVIVWHPSKGMGSVQSLPPDIVSDLFHSVGLIQKPLHQAAVQTQTDGG